MPQYELTTCARYEAQDEFTQGYLEAMFFAAPQAYEGGAEECDSYLNPEYYADRDNDTASDIAPEAFAEIVNDCADFQVGFLPLFAGDERRAGRDFYFTRNGHGAGFWDGGWPEDSAHVLTEHSRSYGTQELYKGIDGRLFVAG